MTVLSAGAGIAELAADVRAGRRSAADIVGAHLERLAAANPALNAVVADRADAARSEAEALDRAVAAGRDPGPLAGVPFTVKDVIATEQLPTTCGSRTMVGHRTGVDAPAVARLRAAGAVLIGKTNTPEFAFGTDTCSPLFGPTSNPRGPFTVGGSSGGEAAAVAAGISAFGLGTDFGGSLRWPAECAQLIGLRPGTGTVPGGGQLPEPEPGSLQEAVQVVGPLTRRTADAAIVLSVLAGQTACLRELSRQAAVRDLAEVEVSWAGTVAGLPAAAEVQNAVRRAADLLGGVGASVRAGVPEVLDSAVGAYTAMRAADPLTRIRLLAEQRDELGRPVVADFTRDLLRHAPAPDQVRAREHARQREQMRTELASWLHGRRLLLLPVALQLPGPVTAAADAADDPSRAFELLAPCRAVSLFGVPSVSVPLGRSAGKVPVSVQLVAPAGGEALALAAAGVLEDAEVWSC